MSEREIAARLAGLDWEGIESALRSRGYARSPKLLSAAECRSLIALYSEDRRFRSRVDMARHRFGEGDYAYFAEPLPPLVAGLRAAFYRRLAPMANRMNEEMGREARYPPTLQAYRRRCRAAGQSKPTPLLLHYRAGGYNRLHRDLYGPLTFPLQAAVMLSRPGVDFEGGEFLLVENLPRQQSRAEAIRARRGEVVIFPVFERPVAGKRGTLRAAMRHGASRVHSGERYVLGIIFHDAE
jgi:hypothetical protein